MSRKNKFSVVFQEDWFSFPFNQKIKVLSGPIEVDGGYAYKIEFIKNGEEGNKNNNTV